MSEESSFKGYKKKKKKSYLSKAKKFGKSGRFGRGSYVSEDIYNYFVRVVEINNGKFETDEERDMFVSNTFEQTVGQEVLLATNQFTSFALERLIPKAPNEPLEKFMSAIASDLRPICCDPFASHVIQSLLKAASDRIMIEASEAEEPWQEKYIAWLVKVGRFLLNNIDEFIWDEYANHIMRTVLEATSGGVINHNKAKEAAAAKPAGNKKTKVPKELRTLFKDYCDTVSTLPQLSDLSSSPLTSGLLQSLVQAAGLVGDKRVVPLTERLLEVLRAKVKAAPLDDPSVRLLEAVLAAAPTPVFSAVCEEFFKGKLKDMACQQSSNFSVQRLLDSCPDKEQLQPLLEELSTAEALEEVLRAGHTGVLLALGKACQRLGAGQGSFIQHLMSVLQCGSPAERQLQVAPLVLALQNFEQYERVAARREEGAPPPCTLHGSLLLQTLLKFNKPIKFVQSLLAMTSADLAAVLADCKGSHVTDAFVTSPFVGEKSREKLCQHLKGHWVGLACSVWGSRSLDAVWRASSVKVRQGVVRELGEQLARLKSDKNGRFVEQSCGVELFRHHPSDWADAQGKAVRTKRLFADILGEEETSAKKHKNN